MVAAKLVMMFTAILFLTKTGMFQVTESVMEKMIRYGCVKPCVEKDSDARRACYKNCYDICRLVCNSLLRSNLIQKCKCRSWSRLEFPRCNKDCGRIDNVNYQYNDYCFLIEKDDFCAKMLEQQQNG
ncbi:Uncharacterised protein g4861 [Pycnogonum litorale]